MRGFYNGGLMIMTGLLLPALPILLLFKKFRTGLRNRLGYLNPLQQEKLQQLPEPRIWFHAASVGELSVVAPIVRYLKKQSDSLSVVVTTTSSSGQQHIAKKMPEIDFSMLAPLDYPGVVQRVLKQIKPQLLVITETELWPNLILCAKAIRCQLALVNGRLSGKNVGRYQIIGSLIRQVLEQFDLLTIQSEHDAERFIQLGANRQRVKILHNVKSDICVTTTAEQIREKLFLPQEQLVWIAGSTRPGEEEIILQAWQDVKEKVPPTTLILAPRHLQRLKDVSKLLEANGLSYCFRSQLTATKKTPAIILLDTMGELADLYACAQVALVGGSLERYGGHNPIEPAIYAVPIIVGPYVDHFANTVKALLQNKGACQVRHAQELAQQVCYLLSDQTAAQEMGRQAKLTMANSQGSAEMTGKSLLKLMLIKKWALEVKTWRQESIKNNNYNRQQESAMDDDWLLR